MVVLRLGKINNEERKFIPTRVDILEEYLHGMEEIEEYELMQTYRDGYKYRRYCDHGNMKYTRNLKMGKVTDVVEIGEEEFLEVLKDTKKSIRKIRKYYQDGEYEIDVDYFMEPVSMIMVEVASLCAPLADYQAPKGFVDVSGNKIYENSSIYQGSILSSSTIIEGTDAVGKSTTVDRLLSMGILCRERSMDMFSKYMEFTVPLEERLEHYYEYLKNHEEKVIFLVNHDKMELERRVSLRDVISEFDKKAYEYNQLYFETYQYMMEHDMLEGKLFLVDCTNLTFEEQVEKVKNIIIN